MKTLPEVRTVQPFINGEFGGGVPGRTFQSLNPATNTPIADVAAGTGEDVDRAVQAARRAFDEGPWPRMSAADRARALHRIADLIDRRGGGVSFAGGPDTREPPTPNRPGPDPPAPRA